MMHSANVGGGFDREIMQISCDGDEKNENSNPKNNEENVTYNHQLSNV